jgi:hypothetical protein
VDGTTEVVSARPLGPGDLVTAVVTASDGVDIFAEASSDYSATGAQP